MKVRDSDMPEETVWDRLFDVDLILSRMQIDRHVETLTEIGFGYGTFTLPAARRISGTLHAFDIDPKMRSVVEKKRQEQPAESTSSGTGNIQLHIRDVIASTTGLPDRSTDYVMLFNIMHHDRPAELLEESNRILKRGGKAGIIHWRSDISTPRGPDLSIRPTPEKICDLLREHSFHVEGEPEILPPYHFGVIGRKVL